MQPLQPPEREAVEGGKVTGEKSVRECYLCYLLRFGDFARGACLEEMFCFSA